MRNAILACSMIALATSTSYGQKIAYADVNAILSVMPENKKINEDLQIYGTGLQKRLDDQKAQLDGMVKEFQGILATGDTAKALEVQKKAIEIDKKLKESAAESEKQLGQKRAELLKPVLDRIGKALDAVADKGGFDYVLNSVDGSGTSVVLKGPEGHDITRTIVDELGIDLKQDPSAQPPADDPKKKK